MKLRTCVSPSGHFTYGIHQPNYQVKNLRETDPVATLGTFTDGSSFKNTQNFPKDDISVPQADTIFEIPNAFPFRGTVYIAKSWADHKASNPSLISLPQQTDVSLSATLREWLGDAQETKPDQIFSILPEPLLLALAATSTDPADLVRLAKQCCEFDYHSENGQPVGLKYGKDKHGREKAIINNHDIFEVLVNNYYLPNDYKDVMVLRPGVQGRSEIIGEKHSRDENSHIFEYLRQNSYIPWGHYAANMANDSIRYQVGDLTLTDINGLRHLYYQRTYIRVAEELKLPLPAGRKEVPVGDLEALRIQIQSFLIDCPEDPPLQFNATLWGWNYGFDFAPSKYRLHASHQQIHQQFALVPARVPAENSIAQLKPPDNEISSYACGDQINAFIREYQQQAGQHFFDDYIRAIRTNSRMDNRSDLKSSLIVHEDNRVMVFVPKSQTSQWELQLMVLNPVGNILEADTAIRNSLDRAMLITMKILTSLGAKMVTVIEYSKRFDSPDHDQHLLYTFLPKMPESPGGFSEAQLRWINGHYPEDFAGACRTVLAKAL